MFHRSSPTKDGYMCKHVNSKTKNLMSQNWRKAMRKHLNIGRPEYRGFMALREKTKQMN